MRIDLIKKNSRFRKLTAYESLILGHGRRESIEHLDVSVGHYR